MHKLEQSRFQVEKIPKNKDHKSNFRKHLTDNKLIAESNYCQLKRLQSFDFVAV